MKKFILASIATFLFAEFIPNKLYHCENLGVSFKDKNQTINIPNNEKTREGLKKTLNHLYSIDIKINGKTLNITAGDKNDTLVYIKKFRNLDMYATKDYQAFLFLDSNHTQVGLSIPSQKTMIYYQCK